MPLYRTETPPIAETLPVISSETIANSLTATPQLLVEADPATVGVAITNESAGAIAYIGFANTVGPAATAHFQYLRPVGDYLEIPFGHNDDVWAVLASGTGSLKVERFYRVS